MTLPCQDIIQDIHQGQWTCHNLIKIKTPSKQGKIGSQWLISTFSDNDFIGLGGPDPVNSVVSNTYPAPLMIFLLAARKMCA